MKQASDGESADRCETGMLLARYSSFTFYSDGKFNFFNQNSFKIILNLNIILSLSLDSPRHT